MYIKGYDNLKLKIPDCHSGESFWAATLELDSDNITELFPYINSVSEKSKYFENPHYIEFLYKQTRCALYQDKLVIAPFEDKESVQSFLEEFIKYLNNLYERKDQIQPDHSKYRHISVLDILKLLPGENCGLCGFKTCMAYAAALSKGEVNIDKCLESGKLKSETVDKLHVILEY